MNLKYPGQPRTEDGEFDFGPQEGDGEILLAAERTYDPVDILEEDGLGGHIYQQHVGKADDFLLNRVRTEKYQFGVVTIDRKRAGSFPSLQAANKLTSSTIADNKAAVDAVVNGATPREFITSTFKTITGKEAYAATPRAQPYMRETFSVGVLIAYDPTRTRGYRVITSYPMNLD